MNGEEVFSDWTEEQGGGLRSGVKFSPVRLISRGRVFSGPTDERGGVELSPVQTDEWGVDFSSIGLIMSGGLDFLVDSFPRTFFQRLQCLRLSCSSGGSCSGGSRNKLLEG